MKRIITLFVVLLLMGCGSGEVSDIEEDSSLEEPVQQETQPVQDRPTAAEEVKESVNEVMEPENSPEAQEILDKYDEKINRGYQFLYAPPPDNLARDVYYVNGDKVKVELYEVNVIDTDSHYNNIYLDYATQTALVLCVEREHLICKDYLEPTPVDWSEHATKLPHHYLDEIHGAEVVGSETLYDRFTEKLVYTDDGEKVTIWVDQFAGIPVKIVRGEGRDLPSIEFRELAINSVYPEDVSP